MAKVDEVKNSVIAQAQDKPAPSLQTLINSSVKELSRATKDQLDADRLARIALTNIRITPDLAKCTPESFLGALFTSAQIGIEPVGGRAYLLPFNNKRKINGEWKTIREVQFIMGYKGLVELFFRHTKSVMLSWGVVHEKDEFAYEYGTNAFLKHIPARSERGMVQGYWVMAQITNGGKPFMFMTAAECLEHGKKHSKTYDGKNFYDNSPWNKNVESMSLKTVLIQLSKLLPLSVEIQQAIAADETSREFRKGIDNAFDLPDTTNWNETPTQPEEGEKPEDPKIEFGEPRK